MPPFQELFNEFSPMIYAGTALLTFGLIPRYGPSLALMLALRSRFAPKRAPQSIRSTEINRIKKMITENDYVIVTGEKGVGKSCLLNTLTEKTPGVIKIYAYQKETKEEIVNKVKYEIKNTPFGMRPKRELHKWLAVDAQPNSVSETFLDQSRENVIDIKSFDREKIWKFKQLQGLFKHVKDFGLEDTAFAVLGGTPSAYENLWFKLKPHLKCGCDARQVIGDYLRHEIFIAINLVEVSQFDDNMKDIIKLFEKEKNCINCQTLVEKKLTRSVPDNVFSKVEQEGDFVLIPASNAISIVLRHGLEIKPTLEELEEIVKRKM